MNFRLGHRQPWKLRSQKTCKLCTSTSTASYLFDCLSGRIHVFFLNWSCCSYIEMLPGINIVVQSDILNRWQEISPCIQIISWGLKAFQVNNFQSPNCNSDIDVVQSFAVHLLMCMMMIHMCSRPWVCRSIKTLKLQRPWDTWILIKGLAVSLMKIHHLFLAFSSTPHFPLIPPPHLTIQWACPVLQIAHKVCARHPSQGWIMEIFQLDNFLAELQMLIRTYISSPESSWLSVAFVHFLSNFVFTPLIVSCGHLFSIFPQLNRSHNAMCFPLSLFSISYLLSELSFYKHVECTLITGTWSHKYWHGLKLWSKQHNVWEMTHNSASLQSALNLLHLCVQLVLPLCLLFQFLALWRFDDFSFSPPIVWIISFYSWDRSCTWHLIFLQKRWFLQIAERWVGCKKTESYVPLTHLLCRHLRAVSLGGGHLIYTTSSWVK
jgi:hypothetical protein